MLNREVFIGEVIKSVNKGMSLQDFQKRIAAKYGLTPQAVYQRHLYLVRQVEKEYEVSKTVRKHKMDKLRKMLNFKAKEEKQSENVLQTLERVAFSR